MSEEIKKTEQGQSSLPERETGEREMTLLEVVFEWTSALIFALVFVLLLLTFVFRQVTVSGPSMNDTLQDGDRLIVTNMMYEVQDGDIIVASHGENYDNAIIKRVIATAGQSLSINYDTGEVKVDGVVLREHYIKGTTKEPSRPLDVPETIPEGYVFVMGDNREHSLDSRSTDIGLIPYNNIVGKVIFRMYPWYSLGSV